MSELTVRFLSSFACGTILSICGSLCQLITFNPMSSPSTLGIQGIAVFLFLVFHFVAMVVELPLGPELYTVASGVLLGSLVLIKRKNEQTFRNREIFAGDKIVLIGLCFNLLVGALFSLLQFLTMTLNVEFPSSMWFGHFRYTNPATLYQFFLTTALMIGFIRSHKKIIRFLNLGPDFCHSLGLDVSKFFRHSLYYIIIAITTVVSFFGVFAFLGLIFPHMLRTIPAFKEDLFLELSLGALLSGLLLGLFDLACYHWTFFSAEVPVGMVSGLLGSLYLVFFFIKKNGISR